MRTLVSALLVMGTAFCTEIVSNSTSSENETRVNSSDFITTYPFLHLQYNGTEFSTAVYLPNATCPFVDASIRFRHLVSRTCPSNYRMTSVDGTLYDPFGLIRYRCHSIRPMDFLINQVYMITPNQLLKFLNSPPKDLYKRNWCMVTFFYSPKCVFSEELALAVNAMPYNFPSIVAVAVDATSFSRLNTRYGIAGTPTLILWVNAQPIARIEDRPLNSTGLASFLHEWTDVESLNVYPTLDEPVIIKVYHVRERWETPAAIGTLILAAIYYWRKWFLSQTVVSGTLQRLGTTPDAVNAFLNGM